MKKFLTVFLCGIMLLCFAACDKNTNSNIHQPKVQTKTILTTKQPLFLTQKTLNASPSMPTMVTVKVAMFPLSI